MEEGAGDNCTLDTDDFLFFFRGEGVGYSTVVKRRIRDRKTTCSIPGRGDWIIFFSGVNFLS